MPWRRLFLRRHSVRWMGRKIQCKVCVLHLAIASFTTDKMQGMTFCNGRTPSTIRVAHFWHRRANHLPPSLGHGGALALLIRAITWEGSSKNMAYVCNRCSHICLLIGNSSIRARRRNVLVKIRLSPQFIKSTNLSSHVYQKWHRDSRLRSRFPGRINGSSLPGQRRAYLVEPSKCLEE
jgi:hypothetical protein